MILLVVVFIIDLMPMKGLCFLHLHIGQLSCALEINFDLSVWPAELTVLTVLVKAGCRLFLFFYPEKIFVKP